MEVPRKPFRFFCLACSKAYNRELICHGEKVVDSAAANYLPKQKTIIMNKTYLSDNNSDEQLNKILQNNIKVVHERQLLERIKQNVMLDKKLSIEVHDEKKQNERIKEEPLNDYEKVKETQTFSGDQKFKCRLCEFESDDKKATTTHVQMVHEGKKHDAIKPKMSYDDLIAEAINNSSNGMLPLSDIYNAISTKYPYYKLESKSWQNCIRHNLSLSNIFVKEGNTKYWKLDEEEFIEFKKAREVKHTNRLKQQQYEIKQKQKYVKTVHEGKKTRGEKPKMTFEELIIEALNNSLNGMLTVSDIYKAISTKYSYYQMEISRKLFSNWQNSVRHCLWVSKKFVKGDKGQLISE